MLYHGKHTARRLSRLLKRRKEGRVSHIRKTLELMRATHREVSMRRKLVAYWTSMLVVLLAAMLALASLFGVFDIRENNLRHALNAHHASTVANITKQTGALAAHVIDLSQEASNALDAQLLTYPTSKLNNDQEGIIKAERTLFSALRTTLESSPCNGAFAIIDATVNTQLDEAENSRAGVYVRFANLSVSEVVGRDVVLYRGAPQIARENSLELHNRWRMEFDTSLMPEYETMLLNSDGRLSESCRWTNRSQLPGTWENVIMVVAPIYASNGTIRGMCGLELSDLLLKLSYPAQSSEYGPVMTAIAPVSDGAVDLSKGMTGELESTYLSNTDKLYVREQPGFNLYSTSSGSFIGLHTPLGLQTADGEDVCALTLIPQEYYKSTASADRTKILFVSLLLFVAALALSRHLSRQFVKPIADAVDAIKANGTIEEGLTGFSEIDALVSVLDSRATNIQPSLLPPDVASLLDEFSSRFETLTATERKIVKLYAENMETSAVAEHLFISIHTARKHNANIYHKLNVGSREELVLYLELFRRCKRLDVLFGEEDASQSSEVEP